MCHVTINDRTFIVAAAQLWNSLLPDVMLHHSLY